MNVADIADDLLLDRDFVGAGRPGHFPASTRTTPGAEDQVEPNPEAESEHSFDGDRLRPRKTRSPSSWSAALRAQGQAPGSRLIRSAPVESVPNVPAPQPSARIR